MKKTISILLLVLLVSAVFPVCAEEAAAVRVGGVTVSAREVKEEYLAYLNTAEMAGVTLSDEEKLQAALDTADEFVIRCLAEVKLRELGEWDLTDNELYTIRENAQQQYDAMWQYFRALPEAAGMEDAELTAYLEENGLSLSLIVEEITRDYRLKKLLTLEGIPAEIDDAAAEKYYEDVLVAAVRERYEGNVPLFEEEVLHAEDAALVWVPEGYRVYYQIVFPVPADLQARLDGILDEAAELTAIAEETYGKVAALAIAGGDYSAESQTYTETMARVDALEVEYGEAWVEVQDSCQARADEIYTRLECGETFENLMTSFEGDHVLLYHPESESWPDTFRAAASSLSEAGDVSSLALCDDGAHMLYYVRDMDSGMLPLDDENRELIKQQAGPEILNLRLKELTDPWREEYGVTVDLSGVID